MFGSLILHHPHLVRTDESPSASTYFYRALDIFELGESLPRRLGDGDDYRLPLFCGRTLVQLAACCLTQQTPTVKTSPFDKLSHERDSYFDSTSTLRISLHGLAATEILSMAVDHLTRSFLHMPHAPSRTLRPFLYVPSVSQGSRFSRCKILHRVGLELLEVAEKLLTASDRAYWGNWTDRNVFGQMELEADVTAWREGLAEARKRCRELG